LDIDAVIEDRFARWGKFLREQAATPILMVGLTRGPGSAFVVTTCEEMTDSQIEATLRAGLAIIERRRRDSRPRR
jgi:hypothetical protein